MFAIILFCATVTINLLSTGYNLYMDRPGTALVSFIVALICAAAAFFRIKDRKGLQTKQL
jgi:uncharacterized membrane protein